MEKDMAIQFLLASRTETSKLIFNLRVRKRRYGLTFDQKWELKQLQNKYNRLDKQIKNLTKSI